MAAPATPLVAALSRVGDRWSFLVVDALLAGPMRFKDLSAAIPGIAPNILSDRLRRLEGSSVLVSQPYSQHPPRAEYRLTQEGRELAGVLRLLASWGAEGHDRGGLHHATCGTTLEARWFCPTCTRVLEDAEDSDLQRV